MKILNTSLKEWTSHPQSQASQPASLAPHISFLRSSPTWTASSGFTSNSSHALRNIVGFGFSAATWLKDNQPTTNTFKWEKFISQPSCRKGNLHNYETSWLIYYQCNQYVNTWMLRWIWDTRTWHLKYFQDSEVWKDNG